MRAEKTLMAIFPSGRISIDQMGAFHVWVGTVTYEELTMVKLALPGARISVGEINVRDMIVVTVRT